MKCFQLFYYIILMVASLKLTATDVDLAIPYANFYGNNSVIVPVEVVDGLIILQAGVNGIFGNFILDTGAEGLVLNNQHFTPDQIIKSKIAMGLGGINKKVGILGIDLFKVEELSFQAIEAQIINLQQIELNKKIKILGLIGYSVIKDFELLLDYRRKIVTFSKVKTNGEMVLPLQHTINKIDSFNLEMGNHLPIIKVLVNSNPKLMGIDTGAEYNLLSLKRSKDIRDVFKIMRVIQVTNASQNPIEAIAGKLYYVVLNQKYKCGALTCVLVNFKFFDQIYGRRLDGILGYEFLAPWLMSINYKKGKLYLHQRKTKQP